MFKSRDNHKNINIEQVVLKDDFQFVGKMSRPMIACSTEYLTVIRRKAVKSQTEFSRLAQLAFLIIHLCKHPF